MASRITEQDAKHMLFRSRAWHSLGTVGDIDMLDARDAFVWAEATLTRPYVRHENNFEPLYDRRVVKLLNHPIAHGSHSDKYKLVQHSFLTQEILPKLVEGGLVESIESIGTYGFGEAAFVSLKLPNDIKIDGYSEVHNIVNLTNGYNNLPLSITNSLGIVVCANTMQTNVLNVPSWYTFKHMGKPEELMTEAVGQFLQRVRLGDGHGKRIEALLEQKLIDEEFHLLVKGLIGPAPARFVWKDDGTRITKRAWGHWNETYEKLWWRYNQDPLNEGPRGTAWGALMAVQAYEQKDKKANSSSGTVRERHHRSLVMGKLDLTDKAVRILEVPKRLSRI